ncbi:UNVERIFIED_CONTAM: putative RNA-binding protein Luc7-like 1 [Sesamum calycinum]|uniref:RNA-binding protein Luc7-like 1 n=1 Tax=Sesamum calycinum TaxID=2727403 RepID=A0AAW2LVN9_9LAMI
MDKGPCPKVHSLQLRKEYEEAKAKGLDNYDRDLEDNIDRLIVECDRKIARALKRLDEEDAKAAIAISVSEVTQTLENIELSKQIKEKLKEADQFDLEGKTDMKIRALEEVEELRTKRADKQAMLLLDAFNKDRASLPQPLTNTSQLAPLPAALPDPHIQDMINEKLKKAEDLGEQGMVDEAQKALERLKHSKRFTSTSLSLTWHVAHLPPRQEAAIDSSKYTAADVRITDQKLRVCDICGAFLSVYDSDRRLADHFGGKLHLGYMLIREKLAELQEERDKKRKTHEEDRRNDKFLVLFRSRDRKSRDRDRESSKDHDKSETRERARDNDHRGRDRDRHYDRHRGYDRERERERDSARSYDSRSRRRSRSRSKERTRDYDRHRYSTLIISLLFCEIAVVAGAGLVKYSCFETFALSPSFLYNVISCCFSFGPVAYYYVGVLIDTSWTKISSSKDGSEVCSSR